MINQASLRCGEPEGGGLDDASAAFLAAVHQALVGPTPQILNPQP